MKKRKINPQNCKYFFKERGWKTSHFEHFPPDYYECRKTHKPCNPKSYYCKIWESK